jgi:hypothetical protein
MWLVFYCSFEFETLKREKIESTLGLFQGERDEVKKND